MCGFEIIHGGSYSGHYLDNTALTADLMANMGTLLNDTMKDFKEAIAIHVSTEIRAAISVQNDRIMEMLGAIPSVKTTSELGITKIDDVYAYLGEIAEAVSNLSSKTIDKLEAVTKDFATAKANQESIAQTRTQLSSISALLTENLKVIIFIRIVRLNLLFKRIAKNVLGSKLEISRITLRLSWNKYSSHILHFPS